jgi:acyl-CoA dehydrogenase
VTTCQYSGTSKGLSGSSSTKAPLASLAKQCRQLNRLSHAYAFLADFALIYLGGALKRKERISARLADGMSYLYLAMATLRYCESQGSHPDEQQHAKWAVAYCYHFAERAMLGVCQNFPSRWLGRLLQWLLFPWGSRMHYPSDQASQQLAKLMTENNHYRQTLCQMLYYSGNPLEPVDKMEYALQCMIKYGSVYQKISDLRRYRFGDLQRKIAEKVDKGELSQADMDLIMTVERARWDAIQVDEFNFDAVKSSAFYPIPLDLNAW